ncbi:MAG: M48 family metalloprotease, partial [Pararhizobium sp.]
ATLPATAPATAAGRANVVRDAEIEGLLKDYARPIFKAAGLSRKGIEVVLINDPDFNAFVDGRRIFVNTGTIMNAETPNEVIGVLAHECGHLADGHQQRLREQMARAQTLAVVGSVLGIGAVAGGIASGSGGAASAGVGMAIGSGSIAGRYLLSYRRSEEMNADQAAVRFLNATHQSAAGMLHTFERFTQAAALAGVNVNPYELSHPLPQERISLLEELARKSPYFSVKDPPALQRRHDLARAKIAAYTGGAARVAQIFRNDPRSLAARYGEAIAAHLAGDTPEGLVKMDSILKQDPSNPYFHEMRGEMLLTLRRADAAADEFEAALKRDPNGAGLIEARLGLALLSTGRKSEMPRAIDALRAGIAAEPDNYPAYRQLSQAYGAAGDVGRAQLAMAEGYFRAGNKTQALAFAMRSLQSLPKGTPAWVRANDILMTEKAKAK